MIRLNFEETKHTSRVDVGLVQENAWIEKEVPPGSVIRDDDLRIMSAERFFEDHTKLYIEIKKRR